uniref:Uncharacterized protein n=1 Tax=Solanum lycopersicum TaxID=4081 RepID=A0A3Q7IX82_SOLLC
EIEPDSDFIAEDFCLQAIIYIEKILKTQRVPIIVGGCFIWIDVEKSVLNRRVDMRFDQMVKAGLVDEVREILIPNITIQESDGPSVEEINIDGDEESKKMILQAAPSSIKCNTRMLICNKLDKIQRLIREKIWSVHHITGTDRFQRRERRRFGRSMDVYCFATMPRYCEDISQK